MDVSYAFVYMGKLLCRNLVCMSKGSGIRNIPSPNIALKQTITTNVKSEKNVHQKRNVTPMGLTKAAWMFFSPSSALSLFTNSKRCLLSFIWAHSFMSDVQMGVNKGRWEGARKKKEKCAEDVFAFHPALSDK